MNEKRIDYNSPAELKAYLEQNGLAMQKKFGQNFLVNGKARATLADSLSVQPGMRVWEVGPGLGAMTSELLKRGAVLTVFEIDRGFIDALKTLFSEYEASGALRIVAGDVLKSWKREAESHGLPDRFFGNLPYNIAASLIGDTIEAHCRFERAVFTVQKEVAERMCAAVGTADYSSFSVLCQWAYRVKPVIDLAGGNFWPKPNVVSRAVALERAEDYPCCENPALFASMQRALFAARRKTVKNNLTRFLSNAENAAAALERAKIPPSLRAEVIPIAKLLELSDIINAGILRP